MASPGVESLRHVLPDDTEREAHDYAIDGVLPLAAFSPDDRQGVADLLRDAGRHALAVVPQGSRTALSLGLPLERYDIALDMRGLHRVVEYVPDDLTVTVEAGMTLRRLREELGEQGQYLPVDPPPDDHVTIGGMLATGRAGAWRGHMPAPRDLLLGMAVAQADGSTARSGGRVVKNVSGYDLHRMHSGALGAFGVIAEASFKVAPLPAATRTLVVRCGDLPQAERLAMHLHEANLATRALTIVAPRAAAHIHLRNEPHVLVEFAGAAPAVARSLAEARRAAQGTPSVEESDGAPWRGLRALAGDDDATVIRLGVPATALRATIAAVRDAGCLAWGHVASGTVIGHAETGLEAGAVRALREQAREAGGFLQVESASPELRRRIDPFDLSEREMVRSLKAQFDPSRVLNPGRWMEGV